MSSFEILRRLDLDLIAFIELAFWMSDMEKLLFLITMRAYKNMRKRAIR